MHTNHGWLFRAFMTNVNEESLKLYLPFRDSYIRFIEEQLSNSSLDDEHRLTLFTMACKTYYLTLPNQLQQQIYCEFREDLVVRMMEVLLKASRIDSYDNITQGLEEAVVRKTLKP